MEFIGLEGVHKVYTRGAIDVPVLRGVSLSIAQREMVALMGASGSGKTTLVNLLGFLDRPTSGRYCFDHRDVTGLGEAERAQLRSARIGFVFQNFNLLPRMTALENVMMPLSYGSHELSAGECRARARALLERVGLGDRIDHEPSRLSGGEQQRVAIARALINRCSLLIADEPTGNLDSKTGEEILGLFRELNHEDGLTIVLVTHDPSVAAHAGRIIRIRDGLVFDDDRPVVRPTVWRTSTDGGGPEAAGLATESTGSPRPILDPPTPCRKWAGEDLRFFARSTATALRSIRRNAMRSALTTLGIIIGVGSLLAISEIGKGAWTAIRSLLTKTGVTTSSSRPARRRATGSASAAAASRR